jgi:CheY-like chemotaxis protein
MPKILIVEDNEENRDSLSRRLQRASVNPSKRVPQSAQVSACSSNQER